MVVEREANGANKTTPGSEGGSLSKKDLTEPTLLEMSPFSFHVSFFFFFAVSLEKFLSSKL